MAESHEPSVFLDTGEAAVPSAGGVLEEDAFDRILRAVAKDLLQRRLDDVRHARDPAR